jgi:mannosyltransferase OCH1-like enzyme
MIPKQVFYIWFGDKEFDDKYVREWSKILTDYNIIKITEQTFFKDDYLNQLLEAKQYTNASNYARLLALYNFGGIYLDTDVEVIKPFDDLLEGKLVFGAEDDIRINTATIISPYGHKLIKEAIEITKTKPIDLRPDFHSPQVITDLISHLGWKKNELFTKDDLIVYPNEYFYPYHYTEKFYPECIKPNTYCIHHWTGSWK